MTDLRQLERLPPWVQTLGWVTVSLVVSMLLALGSASYHLTADGDRSGDVYPVKLGPVSLMLHAGDAPSMPPEEAIARADWAPVALPISLGWRSEVLWAHMRLHNTSAMEQSVLLEVAPPRLTHVRVYSQVGDLWEKQASGAAMRSADRPVNMADLVFPFILAPGEQRTVLVETWSRTTSLNLSFVVYPSSTYTGIALRTNILDVVFVGALLVLGLVSLILGISLRELSLFLLSLRIAVVSVWQLFQAGIWSLILPTSVLTTMADNIWWLSGATMSLTAAFSWAFLSHARLWWPVHLFFALMTVVGLGLPTLASLDWLAARPTHRCQPSFPGCCWRAQR